MAPVCVYMCMYVCTVCICVLMHVRACCVCVCSREILYCFKYIIIHKLLHVIYCFKYSQVIVGESVCVHYSSIGDVCCG